MPTRRYLYLTAIPNLEAALIHAECEALTGAVPDAHGIAISDVCTDVRRGAYVKSCTAVMFEGGSVAEVCAQIQGAQLHADDFRVSAVQFPKKLKINTIKVAAEVGRVIGGNPRLSNPSVTFMTVVTNEKIWFGRLLSESDGWWTIHRKRPYSTSSSLPTRLARVMVNLIARPGQRLIDLCCGTGTIVAEAAHMGLHATGYDINPVMVNGTKGNLAYFNLAADVYLGDASQITGRFDALATDLPYGISLTSDVARDDAILRNARQLAPKVAFVDIRELSSQLVDHGYMLEKVIPAPKHTLVRRIFIAATGT